MEVTVGLCSLQGPRRGPPALPASSALCVPHCGRNSLCLGLDRLLFFSAASPPLPLSWGHSSLDLGPPNSSITPLKNLLPSKVIFPGARYG